MRVAGISDIGLHRKRNEDHFFIDQDKRIFVVCDGMGGHKGGDVASLLAVETIQENLVFTVAEEIIPALQSAVRMANRIIWEKGKNDDTLNEMGTTLTAAVIYDGNIVVAHVGDSSLYLYKENQLIKVTRNHTLAEQMFSDGLLKKEDMRSNVYNHVLTRAVGVENQVQVDIYQEEVQAGDWVLMCTDGLTDLVEDEKIYEILRGADDPEIVAKELLELALSKGGYDNITIVLLCV
ncbi:MAG: serine/threonine-protein phosphatase [Firmicutes bacterium HGW-Firmicutes-15]|nr:MAG: serine/threonine-protein phosphatase [Firmicutes bacterium HGW-Firmicutes-15]